MLVQKQQSGCATSEGRTGAASRQVVGQGVDDPVEVVPSAGFSTQRIRGLPGGHQTRARPANYDSKMKQTTVTDGAAVGKKGKQRNCNRILQLSKKGGRPEGEKGVGHRMYVI